MTLPRLRQAVVAATDLDATCAALERDLGVSSPFHDEGVEHFGLRNAVYAIGDTFVEVVSPTRDGTAAGRQIERAGGDCGYMCMFEVADEASLRARVAASGVRVVHDHTHEDIVDVHLHPADMRGAIVAFDVTQPVGSWRWGGPSWEGTIPAYGTGGLRGLTVAVADPPGVAAKWGRLLDVEPDGAMLMLDDGRQWVIFVPTDGVERIVEVEVETDEARPPGSSVVAGVTMHRLTHEEAAL